MKRVNLEVNDDIRQQINENSKKLNKILKKLIISDEIQEKLLQINRDMNSLKQRVSTVVKKPSPVNLKNWWISCPRK